MSLTYILRKFIIWADGYGKLGEGEFAKLPVVEVHTEDWRPAGLDIPIKVDVGMMPLVFEFKLSSFDPQAYALFGLSCGKAQHYTVRGALANCGPDGASAKAEATMYGYMRRVDADAFEPGRKIIHAFAVHLLHYKLAIAERPIYEIDALNGTRIVNGVDQMTNRRITTTITV